MGEFQTSNRGSKRSYPNHYDLHKFKRKKIKTHVIRLPVIEDKNARDQIAFLHFIHYSWKSKRMLAT